MTFTRFTLAAAIALTLAGCSGFGTKTEEYKGAANRAARPLEVPPELTAPTAEDRYAIPDPRTQTTYSAYAQQGQRAGQGTPAMPGVLPKIEGSRLERAGDQRWLVVKGDPAAVWPVVREFWIDSGFTLQREEPQVGILETDWYEDRSKIPDDLVRRTIGRFFDKLYSTARRDKYRTRLERGTEPGTTEVFISNRAMEEVYTNQYQDNTKWQPTAGDRDLEAEMLAKLQARIAGIDAKSVAAREKEAAKPAVASAAPGTKPAAAAAPAGPLNATLEGAGAGPLVVNDGFDRAWRRVGLALDRVGFTVEDRDRSKGLFFVRYIDPDVDNRSAPKEQGFLDKLAFWRAPPKTPQPQYRIFVADSGSGRSQVVVQDVKGGPENSPTGRKILSLLYDQLK